MKKCTSCIKDIPDTAIHCVFCGAKQGPVQAAGPAQKTIMGYAAADLAKLMPTPAGGPPPGPGGPPGDPHLGSAATMFAGGPGPAPMGPPPMGMPPPMSSPQPMSGMPAEQKTMMAGMGGAPMPPMGQPMGQPMGMGPPMGPPNEQRTMMAGMGGAPMPPPQMNQPMPPPQMGPGGSAPPPMMQPMQPQPMMQQQPMGQPMGQPMQPQRMQQPPYLASQTAAANEPWAGSLRAMMIIFGLFMALMLIGPATLSPSVHFGFEALKGGGKAVIGILFIGGGGILLLLLGLLPVATGVRAAAATIWGLVAVVLGMIGMVQMGGGRGAAAGPMAMFGGWMIYVLFLGMILAPVGLLLRSKFPDAGIGRLIGIVGSLALLSLFIIPSHGQIPLIGLFKMVAHIGQLGKGAILFIWMLVFVIAIVIGLIACLLPGQNSAGAGLWAWVEISFLFVSTVLGVVLMGGGDAIAMMFKQPIFLYSMVMTLALIALPVYGIATLFGFACD